MPNFPSKPLSVAAALIGASLLPALGAGASDSESIPDFMAPGTGWTMINSNATDYVEGFVAYWRNGVYVHMVTLSSPSIVSYIVSFDTPEVVYTSSPYPCRSNSGQTCVDAATSFAGSPYGRIFHFVVDTSKISAGKPNGIIGYEAPTQDDFHS